MTLEPIKSAVAPTKSDTTNQPDGIWRGIYVGTAGDVKIRTMSDEDVVFKNLAAGVVHPIAGKRVWNTGTAALDILICR